VLDDLGAAFEPLSPVKFEFDRLETNPRFASIARPANAAIVAKLRIDMEDRGGRLELLLPYATLEPVRELLLQMFLGEKFGRDSIWESHLAHRQDDGHCRDDFFDLVHWSAPLLSGLMADKSLSQEFVHLLRVGPTPN